jgi:hypothetical protein
LRKDIKNTYIYSKAATVIRNSPRIFWKMAIHLEKNDIVEILHFSEYTRAYGCNRKICICREITTVDQLNEKHTFSPNKILETILNREGFFFVNYFFVQTDAHMY